MLAFVKMAKSTQKNRQLKVQTPLGEDVLLLNRLRTQEEVSRLFKYRAQFVVDEESSKSKIVTELDVSKILGELVTITVEQSNVNTRKLMGVISNFSQVGRRQRYSFYEALIVPSVWKLTQSVQSRIFQQKSVPDILKKMLEGYKFRLQLKQAYKPRNFCVQYFESDFDFVSRLIEEEGMFYYFDHSGDADEMIISDDYTQPKECPNQSSYQYYNPEKMFADKHKALIQSISIDYSLHSGKQTLWDHNFQLPLKKLDNEIKSRQSIGGNQEMEIYRYPGNYAKRYDGIDPTGGESSGELSTIFSDNKRSNESKMFALDSKQKVLNCVSDGITFTAGFRFTLQDHPNADLNRAYLITELAQYFTQSPSFDELDEGAVPNESHFMCVPQGAGAPEYRPLSIIPSPQIQGSQTATVVGPAGEEIFTDKYGRIKVQFHWDREGKYDAKSSCWIRVSQPWAGENWGTICIPRIGQEVIVDFIGGDPDQPIVTGSVYNPSQMPPYELPGNANTMGFKSNTTKGGNGYNEMAIVDGKAGELIRIHAQKDMDTTVLNNDTQYVVVDRKINVDGTHTETVKGDMSTTVTEGNQENTVKTGNQTNTVETGSQTDTVKQDISIESTDSEVKISAKTKIILQVGESSWVEITPDKITINSSKIESLASGQNLISGGTVDINP